MTVTAAVDQSHACRGDAAETALYVVRASDRIAEDIAGHAGARYSSPPQTLEEALALVSLLIGAPADASHMRCEWTHPIAGGRRTVTVEPAAPTH
jgi:hypothetical protein